jgi:Predicted oxidoreductases of the aldo/keto reductase family
MQYVKYGNTDMTVSRFGLGCMRFPEDIDESIEMVRYALDNGVNYIDTAYAYGDSEERVGKALKNGYRNKAYLVTKSPIWNMKRHEDFEKYLDEELKRLGTDYIDVYMLHNLGPDNWKKVNQFDGFSFLDKMIQKGKIRHKAFSFHGKLEAFKEIVDTFDWDMAQIQLNILDEYQQAGVAGLKYTAGKEMAVVIMEPLRGGHIISNCPDEAMELVNKYPQKRSMLEWAFRWLYNMPEVTTILSGTSTLEQLKGNIAIFENAEYNIMSGEDLELVKKIREAFENKNSIKCTGCRYCMPCPQKVDIPEIFKIYNNSTLMSTHWIDKMLYKNTILPVGTGVDRCVGCRQCEKHCPQGIDISNKLKAAHDFLVR